MQSRKDFRIFYVPGKRVKVVVDPYDRSTQVGEILQPYYDYELKNSLSGCNNKAQERMTRAFLGRKMFH
jgi:hypothetical protein